ncbi:hypothetical protein Bhyg_08634 [Pseudolycoriella hygida]|uniref:Uncharacterized protein n=1 Tax=Pseudolycoriella hygida TaxID=35572 RepID=A0A9Q0N555_9DIPT|nr:hypothetical protein Bhyg_08634 [Pseudolycoriella hygida]
MEIKKQSKMKEKSIEKSTESPNEFEVNFPKKEKEGRIESFMNFVENKINRLKSKRIKYNDVKLCAKLVRRKLGFGKSPKRKGYEKLVTDEEKRSIAC